MASGFDIAMRTCDGEEETIEGFLGNDDETSLLFLNYRSLKSSSINNKEENNDDANDVDSTNGVIETYPNHTELTASISLETFMASHDSLHSVDSEIAEKKELFELCRNGEWGTILKWIQNHTREEARDMLKQVKGGVRISALHYAVSSSSRPRTTAAAAHPSSKVIKALVDACPDAARLKSNHISLGGERGGVLPLHLACELGCSSDIIQMIFELYPKGANVKDDSGKTPFEYYANGKGFTAFFHQCFMECSNLNDEEETTSSNDDLQRRKKLEQKKKQQQKLLDQLKEYAPPDEFKDSVIQKCVDDDSTVMMEWLNTMSCNRKVVFRIMFELYLQIAGIMVFVVNTQFYVGNTNGIAVHPTSSSSKGWAIALVAIAQTFCLLKISTFDRRYGGTNTIDYFLDIWNWVDWCAIGLIMTSGVKFLLTTYEKSINDTRDDSSMHQLLVATGFFQFLFFLSHLRKSFYPLSQVIDGTAYVIRILVPFIVISGLTLGAFSLMYFVQNSETLNDGSYETLLQSYLTLFAAIMEGQDNTTDTSLDMVFAIVILILLLNVVVAIVVKAWDDAISNANKTFWRNRLNLIIDVTRHGIVDKFNNASNMQRNRRTTDEDIDLSFEDTDKVWTQAKLTHFIRSCGNGVPKWQVIKHLLWLFLLTILGFLSFGLCWPMFVREFLFKSKCDEPPLDSRKDAYEQHDACKQHMKSQTRDLLAAQKQIDELTSKIDQQSAKIERFEKKVIKMLEKQISMTMKNSNNSIQETTDLGLDKCISSASSKSMDKSTDTVSTGDLKSVDTFTYVSKSFTTANF